METERTDGLRPIDEQLEALLDRSDVKFSDDEIRELREHLQAFQERVAIIRQFALDQGEEPALYLRPVPRGGAR